MSFISTGKKSSPGRGPVVTTPPITGGITATSAVADTAGAAEQIAEQALGSLFGNLPEPSGLVKAAVAARPLQWRRVYQIWQTQRRMRCRRLLPVLQAGQGFIT